MSVPITISAIIKAPINEVWEKWNQPQHIVLWAFASDDWEAPESENDLRTGGKFRTKMAAKDGSASFDFTGTYTEVINKALIAYTMADDRKVKVEFTPQPQGVNIIETFDPEKVNSIQKQRDGWQAILNNFKKYTEEN